MQYCEIRIIFLDQEEFSQFLIRIIRQISSLKPPGNDVRRNVLSIFPGEVCRIPETSDVGSHLPPPPFFSSSRPAVFKLLIPTCKLIAHFEQFIARFSHSNSNWSSTELITHHTRIFQHNIETEKFERGLSQLRELVWDIRKNEYFQLFPINRHA